MLSSQSKEIHKFFAQLIVAATTLMVFAKYFFSMGTVPSGIGNVPLSMEGQMKLQWQSLYFQESLMILRWMVGNKLLKFPTSLFILITIIMILIMILLWLNLLNLLSLMIMLLRLVSRQRKMILLQPSLQVSIFYHLSASEG